MVGFKYASEENGKLLEDVVPPSHKFPSVSCPIVVPMSGPVPPRYVRKSSVPVALNFPTTPFPHAFGSKGAKTPFHGHCPVPVAPYVDW